MASTGAVEAENIEESTLLAPVNSSDLAKMLDIKFWEKGEGAISPLSPLRSPVVADWKAVGSPIGPSNDSLEDSIFENDTRTSSAAANESPEGRSRSRRQRAMSLIERSIFNPRLFATSFDIDEPSGGRMSRASDVGFGSYAELGRSSMTSRDNSPDKVGGGGGSASLSTTSSQVAQIPRTLHEELGVEDAEEAAEIFKRSSMDSPTQKSFSSADKDGSPVKPLSSMPSIFGGRMPFGPTLFGDSTDSLLTADSLEKSSSGVEFGRRHTHVTAGLFGEWTNAAAGVGANVSDFSVDEYFMSPSTISNARRVSGRRHSIAASTAFFPEVEEQLGSLKLNVGPSSAMESSLSPAAASFHFGRSGSLIDYMTNGEDQQPISVSAPITMRDVTFQLSTYRGPLYAVEFKAGRTEIFYVLEIDGKPQMAVRVGDLVIVEADRGEDLGKVTIEISVDKLKQLMMPNHGNRSTAIPDDDSDILTPELAVLVHSKEIVPKRIHRLAQSGDLKLLQAKAQEEAIAMVRCQSRIRQKKLPMEVVDAEYQWDRNKLTFYFCADRRIDFRELVRDLFRIYKTRIWMCAVDKSSPRMLMYTSPSSAGADYGAGTFTPIIGTSGSLYGGASDADYHCFKSSRDLSLS